MLIGESKESDLEVLNGERHEPNVRRMPCVVITGSSRGHDVGQVLNDLLFKFCRSLRIAFVSNHILCGHYVAGGLDELDQQRSERRRSFVGQLVAVLDEVLRNDPMSECSRYLIKNGQRSFLTMWGLFR